MYNWRGYFGDKEIIDYMKYNMRSQVFAKSLQLVLVKGAIKRLQMIKTGKVLKKPKDEATKALINFNRLVKNDSRVESIILPIRDGLTLLRKN